jgi:hypothetical protein
MVTTTTMMATTVMASAMVTTTTCFATAFALAAREMRAMVTLAIAYRKPTSSFGEVIIFVAIAAQLVHVPQLLHLACLHHTRQCR